jgi:hypothetical protein
VFDEVFDLGKLAGQARGQGPPTSLPVVSQQSAQLAAGRLARARRANTRPTSGSNSGNNALASCTVK